MASVGRGRQAVRIVRSIPGHPRGAIRRPHSALRERWLRMGVCVNVEAEAEPPATVKRKPGRPRKVPG